MLREKGLPDASEMHNMGSHLFLYRLKKKKTGNLLSARQHYLVLWGKSLLETQSPVSPHFFWHFSWHSPILLRIACVVPILTYFSCKKEKK